MLPIRVAQVAVFIFALGHSLGMLNTKYRDDAERAVVEALKSYSFDVMGVRRTHWDFYQGMGWSLALFLLFAVVLMQLLIPMAQANPTLTRPVLYALSASLLLMAAFCMRWFFVAPLLLSLIAAGALALAAWRLPNG
jgi:hypothetical protein